MINGKWRSSLRDVKVRRGADIGSDPGYHLVTACLKLKLEGAGRPAKGNLRSGVVVFFFGKTKGKGRREKKLPPSPRLNRGKKGMIAG